VQIVFHRNDRGKSLGLALAPLREGCRRRRTR
jgi:hypothetical protein